MTAADAIVSYKQTKVGSSRSFGFVFTGFFALLAVSPVVLRHGEPRLWAAALSLGFLIVTLAAPTLLQPLNMLWYRFGLVLHAIVNPIVMALIFVLTVIPIGLILRLCGKDVLRLKRDPSAASYWISRSPPGPEPGSLTKQF